MRAFLPEASLVLVFGLLTCVAVPASGQSPATASNAAEASQQAPAGKFVQDLGDRAIKIIADKSLTQAQRSDKYHDLLHEAFDLPTIGHFVLGRAWNTATTEQQQEYTKLFEAIVVKMYGDRLNFYSGESFHVKGARPENDKDIIVNSEIDHPSGAQPTPIDWRVRQEDGKFMVIDVSVEGVSQSITQRDEYASILQRNAGNLDALLNLMRQQLQAPSPSQQQ